MESRCRVTGDRWDFVWEIKYWGLRTLNIITYYLFFYKINETYLCCLPDLVVCLVAIAWPLPLPMKGVTTGSPSSKYEHQHCCVTFEISRKYKDLYGKKTDRFCNLRKWKDFNEEQLGYLTFKNVCQCLLCGPRANQYGRFMDYNVNDFLSIHKEHHWYSSYTLFFLYKKVVFSGPGWIFLFFCRFYS